MHRAECLAHHKLPLDIPAQAAATPFAIPRIESRSRT